MGLFNFIKEVGEKFFGCGEVNVVDVVLEEQK